MSMTSCGRKRSRARVVEMEIERVDVRKKRLRSLSVLSSGLVAVPDVSLQDPGAFCRSACWPAQGCDKDQPREHSDPINQFSLLD